MDRAIFEQAEFSRDGVLHFLSDQTDHMALYRLEEQGPRQISAPEETIVRYAFGPKNELVTVVRDKGGHRLDAEMFRLRLNMTKSVILSEPGVVLSVAKDHQTNALFTLLMSSPSTAPTLMRWEGPNVTCRKIYQEKAPQWTMIHERVTWDHKGKECEAIVYAPKRHERGKLPLVVLVHSGPFAVHTLSWPVKAQHLTVLGYAVCYVNYRGSVEHPRSLIESLRGDWMENITSDIIAAAKACSALPWIDATKVVVWGGDIAGGPVSHALRSGLFRGALAAYPVWKDEQLARRGDRDFLGKTCPLANVPSQVKVALFQGASDQKVLQSETAELVEKLRSAGAQVECHVYDNEDHKWRRKETYRRYYEFAEEFLRNTLD
jgi:dipeptidyl aminopeptidase/acylaminoacyl peptidase